MLMQIDTQLHVVFRIQANYIQSLNIITKGL